MTKYEWERELKNNLKRVPEAEVARILDYYNELFADKAEEGMSEKEIIRKFGNPFDVAYKIFYEYRGSADAEPMETACTPSPFESVSYTPPPTHPPVNLTHTPANPSGAPPRRTFFEPKPQPTPKKSGKGGAIAARLIFFLPYMIVMIVMWSLVVGIAAGGAGAALGGFVLAFAGFFYPSFGAGLAASGAAIAAFGIGCLLCVAAYFLIKIAVKLTQKYFYMGKHKTARNQSNCE